jgi:hypothetical protein
MRAVQLYVKLGKRVSASIRQLGFPTKSALEDWYRECVPLHRMYRRVVSFALEAALNAVGLRRSTSA